MESLDNPVTYFALTSHHHLALNYIISYHTYENFTHHICLSTIVKATPITGLWGPEGSGRLRLQITRHSADEGGKVVTPNYRPPLLIFRVCCHRINSKRNGLESIPGPTDLQRSALTTTLLQAPIHNLKFFI